MALCSPQLQRFFLTWGYCINPECNKSSTKITIPFKSRGGRGRGSSCCSAIAIDVPSSLANVSSVRWGSALLQGARQEMEDDILVVKSSEDLGGFSYAAVFDGHAGFSSVQFLRFVPFSCLRCCAICSFMDSLPLPLNANKLKSIVGLPQFACYFILFWWQLLSSSMVPLHLPVLLSWTT